MKIFLAVAIKRVNMQIELKKAQKFKKQQQQQQQNPDVNSLEIS